MDSVQFDDLLNTAYNKLINKPLLRINSEIDYLVVADIHGDLKSLNYAIKLRERMGIKTLVLLGDYVDRGKHSIECIKKIAELIINDSNFIALRGNHEDQSVYNRYGYSDNLKNIDNDGMSSNRLFSKLPLVLMDSDNIFLHGFIDHKLQCITTLQSLPDNTSFNGYTDEKMKKYPELREILWNDPIFDDNLLDFRTSKRGSIFFEIGKNLTEQFLKNHNKKRIIRGHTSLKDGYLLIHNRQVLSLFSAGSGYTSSPHYAHITKEIINIHKYNTEYSVGKFYLNK